MSANAEVLPRSGIIAPAAKERALTEIANGRQPESWNPEEFAQEPIRGLVQRVFFAGRSLSIRQVVFTPMGPETDVTGLCHQVGRGLSMETHSDVAIVELEILTAQGSARPRLGSAVKSWSVQIAHNLWRVPGFRRRECEENSGTGEYWLSCLTRLRNEFEYAVIHGPAAGISSELALLGQLSDGIVLVLDAHSTRKVTARKLKEQLGATQARILGSVLSGRRFPMPYGIYRRL
jgi:hypothetical protein